MSPELIRYLAAWLWMLTLYGFGFVTAWALWGFRPAQEPLSCPVAVERRGPVRRARATSEHIPGASQTARVGEGHR